MTNVLARRDRALSPEETEQLLRDRLGDDGVVRTTLEYGVFTVWIAQDAWVEAVTRCRDEELLAYDLFDCMFGLDAREDGFDVVVILYSTATGNRIALRTRCAGGREAPTCPSIVDVYRGVDWMERETWDMFGIEFEGHPGLEPRLLTVENFEGWPLRKEFHLTSRAVKPWPGVKEPAELDEDGNVIERVARIGDAPGPYELDKAMAEQAKQANPVPAETLEGAQAAVAAETATQAADSGGVIAGETEQALEHDQKERAEGDVREAGAEAKAAGDELTERASGGDAEDARTKAEERRRQQAEARARKAAERAADADAADAAGTADAADADGDDEGGRS